MDLPLRVCDYCPDTTFTGPVCPTCGYDFTGVYPDIDAAESSAAGSG